MLQISCVVLISCSLYWWLFTAWSSTFGCGQMVWAQAEFIYLIDGTAKCQPAFPYPYPYFFFLNTSRSEFKTLDKKSTSYMVTHTIRNLTDQEMSPVSLQVQTQVPDNSILPVNSNGKNIVLKSHNTWFKYHLLPNQTTWFEQAVRVGDLWGPQR